MGKNNGKRSAQRNGKEEKTMERKKNLEEEWQKGESDGRGE